MQQGSWRLSGRHLVWGAAAAALTSSAPAGAQGERSVVVFGEGPGGEEVASLVASKLGAPYTVRAAGPFRKSLASARAPSLTAAAKDRGSDAKLVARARAAGRAAHADEAILVDVRRSKKGTVVHVWVIDPKGDGSAEVEQDVPMGARASADDQAEGAWNAISQEFPDRGGSPSPSPRENSAREKVAAAPTPETGSRAENAPPAPSSSETPDGEAAGADELPARRAEITRANALATVGVSIQGGSRDFSYVDRLTPTLRPYSLTAAPLAAVDAELYPAARTDTPVLKDLGATVDYAQAFALGSTDSAGAPVSTSWSAFDLGLHQRIPIGKTVLVGLHAGYGEVDYSFKGSLPTTAELPGVQYRFIRGGLDGRISLGEWSVFADGSYLDVLSTGPVGAYFGRATVGGVEGRVGASHSLGRSFEVSLEAAYTRFFYTLNPQPGDPYVAGGALDQMSRASLGVAYLF
jgi:hypothetical protein